jgi:hypothetical protein
MAGRLLRRKQPLAQRPAAVHYIPAANSFVHGTVDIYTGNGAYPIPGPKRSGAVPCLVSGSWMAGHRQAVNTTDKHSHILLLDPTIEVRDPYTGNGQTVGSDADALIIYGMNLGQSVSPWMFVVFSFLTDIPGMGRKKVVLADQISPWPATILLKDTFTDTNGSNLSGHMMDVGAGWTVNGNATISGGQCITAGGLQQAYASSGQNNFSSAALTVVSVQASGKEAGLICRLSDSSNYWDIRLSTTLLDIRKKVAGVITTLASTAVSLAAGTSHTLNISASGSTVTANVDGSNPISATDSFNGTATLHGFFMNASGGPVDNLIFNR